MPRYMPPPLVRGQMVEYVRASGVLALAALAFVLLLSAACVEAFGQLAGWVGVGRFCFGHLVDRLLNWLIGLFCGWSCFGCETVRVVDNRAVDLVGGGLADSLLLGLFNGSASPCMLAAQGCLGGRLHWWPRSATWHWPIGAPSNSAAPGVSASACLRNRGYSSVDCYCHRQRCYCVARGCSCLLCLWLLPPLQRFAGRPPQRPPPPSAPPPGKRGRAAPIEVRMPWQAPPRCPPLQPTRQTLGRTGSSS